MPLACTDGGADRRGAVEDGDGGAGIRTSTVPVMVWLAWLVAPPALVIATIGAVVSSVKLSEAVPVLPKLSVWLATMVCGPSASPVGVNDQAPWRWPSPWRRWRCHRW